MTNVIKKEWQVPRLFDLTTFDSTASQGLISFLEISATVTVHSALSDDVSLYVGLLGQPSTT